MTDELDRAGFVVLRDVFSPDDVARFRAHADARLAAARKDPTFHVGGTLHVDLDPEHAAEISAQPRIRDAVTHVIGEDHVATRAHYRAPTPGHGAQALHADYPPRTYAPPYQVATVIVPLVHFDERNGATRVIPGSHRAPFAVSTQSGVPHPAEVAVVAPAGSAIVFNGHLLHSGTHNDSGETRHALQITYARRGALRYF